MTLQDWASLGQTFQAFISAFAVLGGAVVAYYTFILRREAYPRIEFSVSIETFALQGEYFILEAACYVTNKGLVRHWIKQLELNIRYLLVSDMPERGSDKVLAQTNLPHETGRRGLIPEDWGWTFVEAGVTQRYSYIIHIPKTSSAVMVWVRFWYKERGRETFYTAQKLYSIKDGTLMSGN